MTRALVLAALMLALGSPAMLSRVYGLGSPFKVIYTVDGNVDVFRTSLGCVVTFRGEVVDRVNAVTCSA